MNSPLPGDSITAVSPDSTAASIQTTVETRLTGMPTRRADSPFSAAARMATPNEENRKNAASAAATRGTSSRIISSRSLSTRNRPTVVLAPNGTGNPAARLSIDSVMRNVKSRKSWAAPRVATSTISRGALNSLRITVRSKIPPSAAATPSARGRATQYENPPSLTSHAMAAAATAPTSPWARLMTRLDL